MTEPVQDLQLVALTAGELQPTQQALGAWCEAKCKSLDVELADLHEHMLIASSNGWKLRGLQAAISRTEKRVTYYNKMKQAVEAGFLIVPNFPVTVLAVRVARTKPRQVEAPYQGSHVFNAVPELLPAGEGRYVDDRLFTVDYSHDLTDEKGQKKHVNQYFSSDYDAPDFPFSAVKPAVLDAAQRAMALRIFDRIGMVENNSGTDPIIVGQLLDPRGNDRRATFFIAWWLNTASL